MEIIKENNLGFYNDQGIFTISAKQYDTGRVFKFNIIEDIDLSNCTAYIRILKADGKQFQGDECTIIDAENNVITVDTSVSNGDQILTAEGMNKCELHISGADGKSLTTWNFNIVVQSRVHDGSNLISEDSFDLLDSMRKEEIIRIGNEEKRIINENERIQNELTRIDNENIRITSETDRENAENIRKSNEDIRQANESQRIAGTTDAIKQVQDIITNGNDVISNATDAAEYAIGVGKDLEERRDRGDFKGEQGDPGISIDGTIAFEVDEYGHLICYYKDNTGTPPITLNENGHLIYTIND